MSARVDAIVPVSHAADIWYIFPPVGGPGVGRYWRAYYLSKAWLRMGISNLVIGPGYHHQLQPHEPRAGFENVDGAPHYFLPAPRYSQRQLDRVLAMMRMIPDLVFNRDLAALGRAAPPRVVIYSSPYPLGFIGAWMLARRFGAKLIFEVRDIWPLSLTEILKTPRWHPFVLLSGLCERFAYATSDIVVSLLPRADRHMTARGLDGAKFRYIPNGIDARGDSGGQTDHALVRRIRALRAAGAFVLLHAGSMGETTPLASLLQALAIIERESVADVHVLLVGRGDNEDALRAEAVRLGLSCVEFHPQVDRTVVAAACAEADAGYASSLDLPIYRFGLSPNKIHDYMHAGLPVLYAHTARPNQITDTGGAIGCAVDDPAAIAVALKQLVGMSPAERGAIGEKGRKYVHENHDYARLACAYAEAMGLWHGPKPPKTAG